MDGRTDASDVLLLVFIAFAPPLISLLGAAAVTYAAEEAIKTAIYVAFGLATREEFIEKFLLFEIVWLALPFLHFAVAYAAKRIKIYSELTIGLAPLLLTAGLAASVASITLYDHFFSMLKEGWREITRFLYTMSPFPTYLIAFSRWVHDFE
jgi:hypothetical protein